MLLRIHNHRAASPTGSAPLVPESLNRWALVYPPAGIGQVMRFEFDTKEEVDQHIKDQGVRNLCKPEDIDVFQFTRKQGSELPQEGTHYNKNK